ncbi:MAG: hypothetical protein JNJ50_27555 [Acidobacteria bacterium]|nr:hypothetical protein [Acidobacteriota bacterium]
MKLVRLLPFLPDFVSRRGWQEAYARSAHLPSAQPQASNLSSRPAQYQYAGACFRLAAAVIEDFNADKER